MKHLKISLLVIGLLLGGSSLAGTAYSNSHSNSVTIARMWPSK